TGWASAVLLSILGVDRSTVEQDYLASNTFRHADAGDSLNGVNISSLRAAFAAADKTYGSFDNYVSKGLGLTAGDIAGLKKGLLVKHA
ncbi:tyrosine-protein phosphatase, partial [Streptomyces sp. SID10244]|nr:tyrosine-protein phosphatase [Streptomyces sp. SID10244]